MLSRETIPLLAAADWWQIVAGLIFFVLYGIGQILGAREEAQKKKAQPRRPKPQPPGAPPGPPNQADPLRTEVEEFLRRAQGKPAQQQPAQPEPAQPQRQRLSQQQPLEPRSIEGALREAASRPPQPVAPPARRRLKPQPADLRSESVVEHVARHVNTQGITEHTSRLGEEVALADDHMQTHLQEAFSHQLGSLQHCEQQADEQGPSIAEEIRDLISQPAGMRQLIVANEILRRPEDRWQ